MGVSKGYCRFIWPCRFLPPLSSLNPWCPLHSTCRPQHGRWKAEEPPPAQGLPGGCVPEPAGEAPHHPARSHAGLELGGKPDLVPPGPRRRPEQTRRWEAGSQEGPNGRNVWEEPEAQRWSWLCLQRGKGFRQDDSGKVQLGWGIRWWILTLFSDLSELNLQLTLASMIHVYLNSHTDAENKNIVFLIAVKYTHLFACWLGTRSKVCSVQCNSPAINSTFIKLLIVSFCWGSFVREVLIQMSFYNSDSTVELHHVIPINVAITLPK